MVTKKLPKRIKHVPRIVRVTNRLTDSFREFFQLTFTPGITVLLGFHETARVQDVNSFC